MPLSPRQDMEARRARAMAPSWGPMASSKQIHHYSTAVVASTAKIQASSLIDVPAARRVVFARPPPMTKPAKGAPGNGQALVVPCELRTPEDLPSANVDPIHSTSWPKFATDITIEWLATVVPECAGATGLTTAIVGNGAIGDAHKISLEYANGRGDDQPTSLIAKMAKQDAGNRLSNKDWCIKEVKFYNQLASKVGSALKLCKLLAPAYMDADDGACLILLEDCMTMEGGEVTWKADPQWAMGFDDDVFLTAMVCDLARLHGAFANSDILQSPALKTTGAPDFMHGLSFIPGIAANIGQHFDIATNAQCDLAGCARGTQAMDCFAATLLRHMDKLQLSYNDNGKQTALDDPLGSGYTIVFDRTPMNDANGRATIRAICERLGSRKIQTIIHGDAHPGNVFFQKETHQFTWIDWQAAHVGPPGWELSHLDLCLKHPTKAKFRRVISAFYHAFIDAAPEGSAALYTEEECWEDFVLGIQLWYFAFTNLNLQTLPGMVALAGDDPMHEGSRAIWNTAITANLVLGVREEVAALLQASSG